MNIFLRVFVGLISSLYMNSVIGGDISSNNIPQTVLENIQSRGYSTSFPLGIKKISKGVYILNAYLAPNVFPNETSYYKSIPLIIENEKIIELDQPIFSGEGVNLKYLDINDDGLYDVAVSESFETKYFVRIFMQVKKGEFKKIFQVDSSLPLKFNNIPLNEHGFKTIIVTCDAYPDMEGYAYTVILVVYVFNGEEYVPYDREYAFKVEEKCK